MQQDKAAGQERKREMNDERISFSRGQVGVTAGNVTWAVSNPRGR